MVPARSGCGGRRSRSTARAPEDPVPAWCLRLGSLLGGQEAAPIAREELVHLASHLRAVVQVVTEVGPLNQDGTEFQEKIWDLLYKIPYGKTISYNELAKQYGDLKAIRAVASANGKNNIAIIVPCHRVIGSDHSLVGYAGGLWRKKWLLDHEAKYHLGVQQMFPMSDPLSKEDH